MLCLNASYLWHDIPFAGGIHLTVPMIFRYIKFDTFTPAAERGLPVTRVISRMTLQQILARAVGDDAILNESHVVDFIDDGNKVDEHFFETNEQIYLSDHACRNFVAGLNF
jgi:hypothetical protein